MVLYVDASEDGDLADDCVAEIEASGKPSDDHCLYVQWSMDVPRKYPAEEAGLAPGPLLTPKGRQIDNFTIATGLPGAKNVHIAAHYPGGEPGSTLRWDVGSNERGYRTVKWTVPKRSEFLPLNFP